MILINKNSIDNSQKWGLKKGAIVGTSSARRKSQMLKYRSDVVINDLRGNVPTRINKLRQGDYNAILLAKAGVDRLEIDLSEFVEIVLNPAEFVPAPAQGVLGLQIRESDQELNDILQKMNFPDVQKRINLERNVLNLLDGGCQLPLGVYCNEMNELYVSYAETIDGPCHALKYNVTDFETQAREVIIDLKQRSVLD